MGQASTDGKTTGPDEPSEYRDAWLVDGWYPDGPETEDPTPHPEAYVEVSAGTWAEKRKRAYKPSSLPCVKSDVGTDRSESLRLALLSETVGVWKQLVDVRFRLLALVPALPLIALAASADKVGAASRGLRVCLAGLALVGLVVTVGLYLYDQRNSELYDDLISRIRRIEYELGVHTGIMRGRLAPTTTWTKHDRATLLIYSASATAWAGATVALLVSLIFY
jgi:hypothetical protein